jgi:D-amino-acid dehydrogenase
MRVCVLGAGIAGLASAYRLQREGHEVTVIDRAGAAAGASGANGAQLSYAYVQPLADPSIWRQLPNLLTARDSPLTLKPQWDPDQWRWGLRFLAACRAGASQRTTAQLLQLAAESRQGFDRFRAEHALDCDFSATGKLVLYPDERAFAMARRQLALQQRLGTQQSAVDAAACVEIEPALRHYRDRIAGAVHTPGECAADCQKVCLELLRIVRQGGARFIVGREVTGLAVRRRIVHAVRLDQGEIEADAFVVALGTGSRRLARGLGVYLPVYPLKGYSITLPAAQSPAVPKVNVTVASRKVVFARIGNRLRVAGMAELVGDDLSVPAGRIASLVATARDVFPDCAGSPLDGGWAGLRPATPTGIPIIGALPSAPANLLFNTGHGALGFTLAFGSAARIAGLLRSTTTRFRPVAAEPASCSA